MLKTPDPYTSTLLTISLVSVTLHQPQMSFVEIYNEQLFDLLLSPEACPSRAQQQRRFNVYGGNGNERAARGKRNAPFCSAQKLMTEAVGSGGESALPTPLATIGTPPKQAPELVIYERPDGCTYVKVKRGVKFIRHTPSRVHASSVRFCLGSTISCTCCRRTKSTARIYRSGGSPANTQFVIQ